MQNFSPNIFNYVPVLIIVNYILFQKAFIKRKFSNFLKHLTSILNRLIIKFSLIVLTVIKYNALFKLLLTIIDITNKNSEYDEIF